MPDTRQRIKPNFNGSGSRILFFALGIGAAVVARSHPLVEFPPFIRREVLGAIVYLLHPVFIGAVCPWLDATLFVQLLVLLADLLSHLITLLRRKYRPLQTQPMMQLLQHRRCTAPAICGQRWRR